MHTRIHDLLPLWLYTYLQAIFGHSIMKRTAKIKESVRACVKEREGERDGERDREREKREREKFLKLHCNIMTHSEKTLCIINK